MRAEKQYLVDDLGTHLDKGDYLFLADYRGLTVKETAELREGLAAQQAEFHVVKNSILQVAAKNREMPDFSDMLEGQVAIIVGGENPSEVAKVVTKFAKAKDKVLPKGGVLSGNRLEADDIEALSKLPSLDILQAQFLGLLNTPAEQFVRLANAIPQNMLNVLDAKRRSDEEAA